MRADTTNFSKFLVPWEPMQSFDVLILGAGLTGTRIANQLSQKNLKTALVSLPDKNEDYLQQLVAAISCHPERSEGPPSLEAGDSSPLAQNDNVHRIETQRFPFFLSERSVSVNDEEIRFKDAVLATGCGPRLVPDMNNALTPIELFQMPSLPSQTTIWGAGPSGVCAAIKIARRGGKIRLQSKHERVLPNEDETLSDFATQQLQKAGVEIARAGEAVAATDPNVMCIGLKPHSDELKTKAAFIYVDPSSGRVKTDVLMRTANPHVYAAGAVTGPPFHLNFERFQAELVVENMTAPFFMKHRCAPEAFPVLIPFATPLARIGMTEREASKKFKDVGVVIQPFDNGVVKLIALKRSGLLVGAHVAGAGADGLILFFDLLMRAEIPLRDIGERHHFPSSPLSNATAEAVERWIALAGR